MAYPVTHPIDELRVYGRTSSVANGQTVSIAAPFKGRIVKVGGMVSAAITTADATCTTSIAGTAITGGAFTLTQSGSAQGTQSSSIPSAANAVNEDDEIRFAFTGTGTAGGETSLYAVVRRG